MKNDKIKRRIYVFGVFLLTHIALMLLLVWAGPSQILPKFSSRIYANFVVASIAVFASIVMWIQSFCLLCHLPISSEEELDRYLLHLLWGWFLVGVLLGLWIYTVFYDSEFYMGIGTGINQPIVMVDYGICCSAIKVWRRNC